MKNNTDKTIKLFLKLKRYINKKDLDNTYKDYNDFKKNCPQNIQDRLNTFNLLLSKINKLCGIEVAKNLLKR